MSTNTMTLTNWNYERFGNTIISATNAILVAALYKCNLALPNRLYGIDKFVAKNNILCAHDLMSITSIHLNATCNIKQPSRYWWFYNASSTNNSIVRQQFPHWRSSIHVLHQLRKYLEINATHSLGLPYPVSANTSCLAAHVRSGDIFNGSYSKKDGHWHSAIVHPGYLQPPLSYFLSIAKSYLNRSTQGHVYFLCEDLLNPVCEVLTVISATDPSMSVVTTSFRETLNLIHSCEEVVLSKSSLNGFLMLSERLRRVHQFGVSPGRENHTTPAEVTVTKVGHRAVGYDTAHPWDNSEASRHRLLQPYEMQAHSCWYIYYHSVS